MPLTRFIEVDGRPIRIYDGLVALPLIQQLTDALLSASFVRSEVARQETAAFRHWAVDIPLETAPQLAVHEPTLTALRDFADCADYRVLRCYCNHAAYGDMLFTHTDVQPGQRGLTALWYIAPEWNVEWGGETLFYNSNMDAEVAVSPRPGRLVIFDGAITHVGRPPNRVCYAPRYTLAYKLVPAIA